MTLGVNITAGLGFIASGQQAAFAIAAFGRKRIICPLSLQAMEG